MKQQKSIDILLVEDNPGDTRLIEEVFKDVTVCNTLYAVKDGCQALDFLFQRGAFAQAPKPELILLDINLPKKSGLDVLAEIKAHSRLRRIPAVILTTSEAERDILKSYDLHANAYVVKPLDLEQFINIVKAIEGFWLDIVKLSPNGWSAVGDEH